MGKPRAVVLDVDGTLVRLRGSLGELYSEALLSCGVRLSPETLHNATLKTWGGFEEQYLHSEGDYATSSAREVLLWNEFVRRSLQECGAGLEHRHDLLAAVYSFFSMGRSRCIMSGAVEACRSLSEAGVRVIAATNNDLRTKQVLHDLGFSPFVDLVVTAGELGWKKPSPKFFRKLAEVAELPIGEMLHVGNSRRLDVDAAREGGMRALLFDPDGEDSDDTISDLRVLAGICGCTSTGAKSPQI